MESKRFLTASDVYKMSRPYVQKILYKNVQLISFFYMVFQPI